MWLVRLKCADVFCVAADKSVLRNHNMTGSRDSCPVCSLKFHGRQRFISCCGPCETRFHLECLNMSDAEFDFLTNTGVSTYKCSKCQKASKCMRNDNTPVKGIAIVNNKDSSSSPKKVISPTRDLDLPPFRPNETLAVQLETVRLNGINTNEQIKELSELVKSLFSEVKCLREENSVMRAQLDRLENQHLSKKQDDKIANGDRTTPPARQAPTYSNVAARNTRPRPTTPPPHSTQPKALQTTEEVTTGDSGDFTVVSYRKKPRSPKVPAVKPRRERNLNVGSLSSSNLTVVKPRPRTRALFVSRFGASVSTTDVENVIRQQLQLDLLKCSRLKTKFPNYASFHVLVQESDFDLINNSDIWPSGCLFAPFYGKLQPEQLYSDPPMSASGGGSTPPRDKCPK